MNNNLTLRDVLKHSAGEIRAIMAQTTDNWQKEVHEDHDLLDVIEHHGRLWKYELRDKAVEVLRTGLKIACELKRKKVLKFNRKELLDYFKTDIHASTWEMDSHQLELYLRDLKASVIIIHNIYTK